MKLTYLGLPDAEDPKVALVPIPFEFTTSWLKGTKDAPLEIIKVSPNLEFFDEETAIIPHLDLGFFTENVGELSADLSIALRQVENMVARQVERRLFSIFLGGEHTISYPIVKVYREFYPHLRVLHLDAHLDQRDEYLGSKLNHATVLRRIKELGVPVLSVGVRSVSVEEKETFDRERHSIVLASEFFEDEAKALQRITDFIGEGLVYLSLDVDVFDPSIAPGVGTPEPGGLTWYQVLKILRLFFAGKVLAMDIVEVRPIPQHPVTEYLVAKLILKAAAYLASQTR